MTNTPFDLMDLIISEANNKVNKYISNVSNEIEKPQPNYPKVMESYIHTDPGNPQVRLKEYEPDTNLSQINKAFAKMKEGADNDKLSDTFRSEDIEETRFSTARSTQKTIASFNRYLSILQASC